MTAATLVRPEQVRLNHPQARVHEIVSVRFDRDHGYVYLTRCELELRASSTAMRTTRPATCSVCAWVPS